MCDKNGIILIKRITGLFVKKRLIYKQVMKALNKGVKQSRILE